MNKDDFTRFFEYYNSQEMGYLHHLFLIELAKRGWVTRHVTHIMYPYGFSDVEYYNEGLNIKIPDIIHFTWDLKIDWDISRKFCSTYLALLVIGAEELAHEYLCHLTVITPDLDANDMYNLYIRLTQVPLSEIKNGTSGPE